MIYCRFHDGSGLGDMLHRYITVRSLADKKGYEFGAIGNFKGDFFLEQPKQTSSPIQFNVFEEKCVTNSNGVDIRSYDPEINFVEDNTIIDGSFEDDKYWRHNLDNISKWLAVEPLNVPEDKVILGFRGGEYAGNSDLFLPQEYFMQGIGFMVKSGEKTVDVHTDDPHLAKEFFKPLPITVIENERISHSKHTNMEFNWRSARYAKYAIIPNSAFFILPRLLKHHEDPTAVTIAPRGWARRNTKTWARPACYYPEFTYL